MEGTVDSPAAGTRFELVKPAVTTRQLVMYAGASGDYNRIHYDLPFAQQAGLGGVIAHGMLTMGFAAQAVTDWAGLGCFVQEIAARFRSPVRPGDRVTIAGTVDRSFDTDGRVACAVTLEGRVGDKMVLNGDAVVVLPPAPPS